MTGTDYTGSCKSNYHSTTIMIALLYQYDGRTVNTKYSIPLYFPGQMHAYIRDCSNGKNFSTPDIPQFEYLVPKLNHTICVYRTKILYCVTLCNSGDFCNGPQIDSGCIHPPAQMWIILSIVLTLFITRI